MSFRKRLKRTANFFKNGGLRSNLGQNLRDSLELIKGRKRKKVRWEKGNSDFSDGSTIDGIMTTASMCNINDTGLDSSADDSDSSIEETRDNRGNVVVPGIVIDMVGSTHADSDLDDTKHLNIKNSTMNQSHYGNDVDDAPDVSPIKKLKKAKKILLNAGSGMMASILDGSSSYVESLRRDLQDGQMLTQNVRKEQEVLDEMKKIVLEDRNNNSMILMAKEKEPCIIEPMLDISLTDDDDDDADGWSPKKKNITEEREWLEADITAGGSSKQSTYLHPLRSSTFTPAWKQSIAKPIRPSKRSFRTSSPSPRSNGNLLSPNAKRSLLQISSIQELAPDESLSLYKDVNSGHTVNSDEIVPFSTLSANASRLSVAACEDKGELAQEKDVTADVMTSCERPLPQFPFNDGCAVEVPLGFANHSVSFHRSPVIRTKVEEARGSRSYADIGDDAPGKMVGHSGGRENEELGNVLSVEGVNGSVGDAEAKADAGYNTHGKLVGPTGKGGCEELDILDAIPSPVRYVVRTTGRQNVIAAPDDWFETL